MIAVYINTAQMPATIMDSPETDTVKVPSKLQITISEPSLQGVKQEDRLTVRNVIYLLHACKHPARMCVSWSVANSRDGTGYEITGFLDPSKDYEIFKEELDLITLADPLRVKSISVGKSGDAPRIIIKVLSKSEPVMMTELDVMTVQKKRRLWSERQ
jgi:hypothetical protein